MIDVLFAVIALIIISPFCLVFHEFGHAFAAKMVKSNNVELTIGLGKRLWQAEIKGIQITVRRLFFMNSYTSSGRDPSYTPPERVLITVMGPLFSIVLAMLFFVAYGFFGMIPIIFLLYLFNLWIGIINLLPFKIGQKESDGYTICKQLFQWKKANN